MGGTEGWARPASPGAEGLWGWGGAGWQEVPPRKRLRAVPWRRPGGGGLRCCSERCSPCPLAGPCMTRLRHGMCCSSSTNGAASSPSSGCSALARGSSGLPWPLPPWPVHQPRFESPDRGRLDLRSTLWRYGLAVGCGAIGKVWASSPAWSKRVGTILSVRAGRVRGSRPSWISRSG